MKISLEALQMLDAIDRRGTFAAAAEELHRVPSAVTHAVQKLEEELDVRLFDRAARRASLTPAGRTLLDEGRHILRAAADLECRVKRVATGWEAELVIAVDALIDCTALFPLLDRFYRDAAGTRLKLGYEVLNGCWDALASRRADLVIGAPGEAPSGGGYVTRPFAEVRFLFAVAPDHALAAAPEPIAADEIVCHRAVSVADTSRHLEARTTGLLSGQDVLTVGDPAAKLAAQIAGLGIGFLPEAVALREAEAGRLVIKQVVEPKPAMFTNIAWRADHRGKALKWFVAAMEETVLRARL
jgi:DNA-binding transcriptional LysR family regulator